MMKRSMILKIVAMLAVIAVVSVALTVWLPSTPKWEKGETVRIVTSFYPVYIAARQVTDGIDGVQVINMVDAQTGCLHEYQMAPVDRAVLESADVLVMNGAGAEPFLDAALAQMPTLRVVDLSQGQALLESGHVHTHEHEHDHDRESEEDTAYNSHLWVSPLRYRQQVQVLYQALAQADPAHRDAYVHNGERYIQEIDAVWARMQHAAAPFSDMPTVLFHDSLAYLAEDLSLPVIAALNVGEESGVSAAELAATEDALTGLPQAMFLFDDQYQAVQYTYLQDLPTTAWRLSVDTAVTGEDDPDAWLRAMNTLCDMWEAAV